MDSSERKYIAIYFTDIHFTTDFGRSSKKEILIFGITLLLTHTSQPTRSDPTIGAFPSHIQEYTVIEDLLYILMVMSGRECCRQD
jgi:hypothetical protein